MQLSTCYRCLVATGRARATGLQGLHPVETTREREQQFDEQLRWYPGRVEVTRRSRLTYFEAVVAVEGR